MNACAQAVVSVDAPNAKSVEAHTPSSSCAFAGDGLIGVANLKKYRR